MIDDRIAFFTADTTAETVFTNTTGQVTTIETVTIAQGSTAGATVVRLSIGADGATTRVFEQTVPAGTFSQPFHVNIRVEGTEIVQGSSTVTDDVAVVTLNGRRVLIA